MAVQLGTAEKWAVSVGRSHPSGQESLKELHSEWELESGLLKMCSLGC